jgi:uncharacterized protein YecT (DUF1311 family)
MRLLPILTAVVIGFAFISPIRAQSQMEMNADALDQFDKADKELNEVYQKVMKSIDDDVTKKKVIAVQKAWLVLRDAQADLDADAERGGSLAKLLWAQSETEMTKARIVELKKYLADNQGK